VPELEGLDFIVQVENTPDAYREALAKVIADAHYRGEIGRQTGEHAWQRFAPALTEAKYVEVYKRFALNIALPESTARACNALDFFRCVKCGGRLAEPDGEGIKCVSCEAAYPTVSGVPLLVNDWVKHEHEISHAQALKPDWYIEEQLGGQASPWRHHLKKRIRYVEHVIQHHLQKNGIARVPRLLDLGCGDGTNLPWLAPFAERIYGSDYNPLRLRRAQKRVPDATLFLADILDYPSADDQFDVIFFNHVIEHIKDDVAALATVARILKPGGLLILGTPNEGSWWWQLAYDRAPQTRATTDHVHFYTGKTISAKIAGQGLSIRHVEHLGWGPPDWEWDMKLRGYKILDDAFEWIGRLLLPSQASSLYILAEKPAA
jgi:2-polyprenyl-3-methyl-5-hydroxy-6-metoxy-1,4-benzoquinol methylase